MVGDRVRDVGRIQILVGEGWVRCRRCDFVPARTSNFRVQAFQGLGLAALCRPISEFPNLAFQRFGILPSVCLWGYDLSAIFQGLFMSAQEIIAELPKLSLGELESVDHRIHELLRRPADGGQRFWGEALLEVAGSVKGRPADFAKNHDHYLHGAPKQ